MSEEAHRDERRSRYSHCEKARTPMSERRILAEAKTPEEIRVVLFADTWLKHVLNPHSGHAELELHLDAVLETLESPDFREAERWRARERFFKRDVGPTRWLMVVVDFAKEPARVVTAFGYGHGRSPDGWAP
jgi:hypothetical protein